MRHLALLLLLATPLAARAINTCELGGDHVNPANGNTTAGKTGLMRCRDADTGVLVREEELRQGKSVGLVRFFKAGVLEREYSVNERGNRDGLSREYAATPGPANPLLREETYRNGSTVGLARSWNAAGTLKRAAFHGDDGREQAAADFNDQGQLTDLRCANAPRLAGAADDRAWCGHDGKAATVPLYNARGTLTGRRTFLKGELQIRESLFDDGRVRERIEHGAQGGVERGFWPDGKPRRELQWTWLASGDARRRLTTLEQEYHESGTLVHERRYRPVDGGAELAAEKRWYLNGQPKSASEFVREGERPLRRDTTFHDNGKPSFEGRWLLAGRYGETPLGVHQGFDDAGRLRAERHHDERGRITRERALDEQGRVTRDDEVFEDGSRRAYSR